MNDQVKSLLTNALTPSEELDEETNMGIMNDVMNRVTNQILAIASAEIDLSGRGCAVLAGIIEGILATAAIFGKYILRKDIEGASEIMKTDMGKDLVHYIDAHETSFSNDQMLISIKEGQKVIINLFGRGKSDG